MVTKSQHFIPRLHLQHFLGNQPRGQVWTYDALDGRAWSAVPEETATQTHFYSVKSDDGSVDTRIEDFLAVIESRAAPVYTQLLAGNIPPSGQARVNFSEFLALMYSRTPAMRRMYAELHGRSMQIQSFAYASNDAAFNTLMRRYEADQRIALDENAKRNLRETMLDPSGYEFHVSSEFTLPALNIADKLAPIFYNMRWCLLKSEHGFFITSDNPVVRQVEPGTSHPFYGDHGFMNKTVSVTFPLSTKFVLLMGWTNYATGYQSVARDVVDELNRARAAFSDRYLYAHIRHGKIEQLAAKFKHSRPGMTTRGFGPKNFAMVKVARRLK